MLQTSFRWPLTLTHTLAHLHEEDQPPLIYLLEFLAAVASVLHTILFTNSPMNLLLVFF
jgi:hypothetical protein